MATKYDNDKSLVNLVKDHGDEKALTQLMDRHSGIFHNTVTRYLPPSLSNSEKEDIFEEKPTFFFEAIRSFDESKNVAFVTWLANKTKYLLLSRRSYEAAQPPICEFNENHGSSTSLSPDAYLVKKDESEKILELVFDKYGFDIYSIFKDKYFGGPKQTGKTFGEIAEEKGISPQAIQAKHRTVLKFLKRKLA